MKTLLKGFSSAELSRKSSVEGFLEDHYYKQGAVSKDIVQQIMQSIQTHYTHKYITPSVIKKHIDNYRKIEYLRSRNTTSRTLNQSTSQNTNTNNN